MGLTAAHIDRAWVAGLMKVDEEEIRAFSLDELGGAQGVISRYEKSTSESIVGHRVLTVCSPDREDRFVIKSKVPGSVVRRRLEEVYRKLDPELADLGRALSPSILDDCHGRELAIYAMDLPALHSITPSIARVWRDDASQIFVIVMELLEGVRHEKTLGGLDVWTAADIDCVLSQLARLHGELLGRISPTAPPSWLVALDRLNDDRMLAYQAALLRYNRDTFPELFDAARTRRIESFLSSAKQRHRAIMDRPLTLIHGDFTPRNVCLKVGGETRLCAYDWELAQVHLPQRDVCEFLSYVLNPRRGWKDESTGRLLDRYCNSLQSAWGRAIGPADFRRDLSLAIEELCTFKLLVQGITHQLLGNRDYFERLVHNAFDGIEAFGWEA